MINNNKRDSGILVLILMSIFMIASYGLFGGEAEGIIKDLDTCKETIKMTDNPFERIFHQYTCIYNKTNSGSIINGLCARVEINDNGICTKAYIYKKDSEVTCTSPDEHITKTRECVCNEGFEWNEEIKKCDIPATTRKSMEEYIKNLDFSKYSRH